MLALAATLWLVGSVVWYGVYLANGSHVPTPPGVWDVFYGTARILVIVALVIAMQSVISFSFAMLDAIVLTAAGIALAAPFVHHGLEHGATATSLFTLNRPVLSIVTLILIASAALGSWEGIPLSFAMLGLAELALTVGNLIYSYAAVQDAYVDDRWADLAWGTGAVIAILAASVIVLRIDRPVGLPTRPKIPEVPAGSRAVLLLCLTALASTLAVASYGLFIASNGIVLVGLIASVSIGVAMAIRARASLRATEDAYIRLDRALGDTERARDLMTLTNEELRRANVEIRAMHIAFADALNLADERSDGRMRVLIERTGRDLAAILEEELEDQ